MRSTFSRIGFESMTFTHRDFAINQNVINIMDDSVHNCIGNGVVILGGYDSGIPVIRLVLCAEDNGSFLASGFYDF